MTALPDHAEVVVIGQGDIVGASLVHHLIEEGWNDILGLEKPSIPTDIGSTFHASDFCFMTSHDDLRDRLLFVVLLARSYDRLACSKRPQIGRDFNVINAGQCQEDPARN